MVTTEQIVRGVGLMSLATAIVLALKTLNDATNELKIVGDRATGWFTITRKPKTEAEHSLSEGSGAKNSQGQGQVVGDAVVPDNIDQVSVDSFTTCSRASSQVHFCKECCQLSNVPPYHHIFFD